MEYYAAVNRNEESLHIQLCRISLIQARKRNVCIVCHYLSKKGEVTNIHTYLFFFKKRKYYMVYFLKGYLTEKGEKRVERIEIEATHL